MLCIFYWCIGKFSAHLITRTCANHYFLRPKQAFFPARFKDHEWWSYPVSRPHLWIVAVDRLQRETFVACFVLLFGKLDSVENIDGEDWNRLSITLAPQLLYSAHFAYLMRFSNTIGGERLLVFPSNPCQFTKSKISMFYNEAILSAGLFSTLVFLLCFARPD